jgi:deoxyribonuclease IV
MELLYGQHITGGAEMFRGLRHAVDTGATAMQVFPGGNLSYTVSKRFTRERETFALLDQLEAKVVHASYFILTTQPEGEKRTKSIWGAIQMLEWCDLIGAQWLVVHPGSTKRVGWEELAAQWLEEVMQAYQGTTTLCLETMAGASSLGRSVADIAQFCNRDPRIKVCVDLTHSWSAGLGVGQLSLLPNVLGSRLAVCHFNVPNSGVKCGSGIDRHSVGFHQTDWTYHEIEQLWHAYKHVPCILEGTPTPKRDYELLRSWK